MFRVQIILWSSSTSTTVGTWGNFGRLRGSLIPCELLRSDAGSDTHVLSDHWDTLVMDTYTRATDIHQRLSSPGRTGALRLRALRAPPISRAAARLLRLPTPAPAPAAEAGAIDLDEPAANF